MSTKKQELDLFYTELEIAGMLHIPVKTLRSRRHNGTNHPPYTEVGRQVLYPKALVQKWLLTLPTTWEVRRVS